MTTIIHRNESTIWQDSHFKIIYTLLRCIQDRNTSPSDFILLPQSRLLLSRLLITITIQYFKLRRVMCNVLKVEYIIYSIAVL